MSAHLPENTVFAGRYRVVRCIATGGMGAVYEVVHTETNRRRALKIMHPHVFQSEDLRERFKREARIAADIDSEHIVDVSDAGIDEATQTPFMVMELLRGEDLGKRVKRTGKLPHAEALTYLRQTALALQRTHEASIVHRDLKPDNLFLTHRDDGTPRIKILDFGVAKIVADNATGPGTQSLGTPLYMAPEQFFTGAKITAAADIYALGLVAFTLLAGAPYWRTESTDAGGLLQFITIAIRGPQEPALRRALSFGVTLPVGFEAWFARATAPAPKDRFPTATEAIRALERVFAESPDTDFDATVPLPSRPPASSAPIFSSTPGTLGAVTSQARNGPPSVVARGASRKASLLPLIAGIVLLGLSGLIAVAWVVLGLSGRAPSSVEASAGPSIPAPANPTAPPAPPTIAAPSATTNITPAQEPGNIAPSETSKKASPIRTTQTAPAPTNPKKSAAPATPKSLLGQD